MPDESISDESPSLTQTPPCEPESEFTEDGRKIRSMGRSRKGVAKKGQGYGVSIEAEERALANTRIKTKEANARRAEERAVKRGESLEVPVINGVKFIKNPLCRYKNDYVLAHRLIREGKFDEVEVYRTLVRTDLWFVVYFVLGWPGANHPFIVDACREVEEGPQSQTLDVWFREAGKSTVITTARTLQRILNNPQERICIFSYSAGAAKPFLRALKTVMEGSEFLIDLFPDILWKNPSSEAPKWSELDGLIVKREGFHKESTIESHGLLEGMPTGKHFSGLLYDDIVTADLVTTPDIMEKVKERFDISLNVGTSDGWHQVIGTFYHHEDPLVYIMGKVGKEGNRLYLTRRKPATVDGTFSGASVFLPESRLDLLRGNRKQFYCQQLLDPTPMGEQRLDFTRIVRVSKDDVPKNLYKFMVVDPAGSEGKLVKAGAEADAWAAWVVGVVPEMGDKGASDIYILDGFVEAMSIDVALSEIVALYLRNQRVISVGVEKVGAMTFEIHVANALREKGCWISLDAGSLVALSPAGRKKEFRIEQNLGWPLANGRIHISSKVRSCYVDRLKMEMDRFPYWRDDGMDALSYVYDMIAEYRFGKSVIWTPDVSKVDAYREEEKKSIYNWMAA